MDDEKSRCAYPKENRHCQVVAVFSGICDSTNVVDVEVVEDIELDFAGDSSPIEARHGRSRRVAGSREEKTNDAKT